MVPQILLWEIFSNSPGYDFAAAFVLALSLFPDLALWDLDVTPTTISLVGLNQNPLFYLLVCKLDESKSFTFLTSWSFFSAGPSKFHQKDQSILWYHLQRSSKVNQGWSGHRSGQDLLQNQPWYSCNTCPHHSRFPLQPRLVFIGRVLDPSTNVGVQTPPFFCWGKHNLSLQPYSPECVCL